jgi:hypothetical protein
MRYIESSKKCNHCAHHGRVFWEGKIEHRCEKFECRFKDRYLFLKSFTRNRIPVVPIADQRVKMIRKEKNDLTGIHAGP